MSKRIVTRQHRVHAGVPSCGDGSSSDELDVALAGLSYHDDSSSDELGAPVPFLAAPKRRTIVHPGGFHEKRAYSSNGAPRIRKKELYSEEEVRVFSEKYNAYFYALTGKHLDFKITPTSQPYLSMLEACRHRDQVLMTLFEEPPVIWELMGGSGSDSIAFMLDLAPKEIVIVEYGIGEDGEKTREKNALIHNINSFCKCFEEYRDAFDPQDPGAAHKRVRVEYTTARDYINRSNPIDRSTGKRPRLHVNMVYLDPSWDKAFYQAVETEGHKKARDDQEDEGEEEEKYVPNIVEEYESTPEELFHYLQAQVWGPIKENNIHVDVYLLKTRWEWSHVQKQLEQVNSDYYIPYSIQAVPFQEHLAGPAGKYGEIKGQFHWITMIHKNYRTIYDRRTKWYMDLIRKGKKVYVDERTIIKPFHPRYTDHLQFPTVYETPHEHCFEVAPPPPAKGKREQAGGPKVRIPRKEPKKPYEPPENWREQERPQVPPPPENVWETRRKEAERRKQEQGPGYKGFYDVLPPDQESSLRSRSRKVLRQFSSA